MKMDAISKNICSDRLLKNGDGQEKKKGQKSNNKRKKL